MTESRPSGESRDILRAVDRWLPPGIRDNAALSLEGLIRSRVLTVILLSSIVTTTFSFLTCVVFSLTTDLDFSNALWMSIVCVGLVMLIYLYFYKSGRFDSAGVLYSLSFFIVCTSVILVTGGYQSPVLPVLMSCPVLAFLVGGRYEGFYNAALVFVVSIALLTLDGIGFEMVQLIPTAAFPYISGIVWLVTLALLVVCLYIYDLLLDEKRSIRARQ